MQCEAPDCDERDSFDATGKSPYGTGWRLVGSSHLPFEGTSANTRLCPDCADDYGHL